MQNSEFIIIRNSKIWIFGQNQSEIYEFIINLKWIRWAYSYAIAVVTLPNNHYNDICGLLCTWYFWHLSHIILHFPVSVPVLEVATLIYDPNTNTNTNTNTIHILNQFPFIFGKFRRWASRIKLCFVLNCLIHFAYCSSRFRFGLLIFIFIFIFD